MVGCGWWQLGLVALGSAMAAASVAGVLVASIVSESMRRRERARRRLAVATAIGAPAQGRVSRSPW